MTMFKAGDKVKVIKGGRGCHPQCLGEIVTITEYSPIGYKDKSGVRTTPTKGSSNSNTGSYDYFMGVDSFELVKPATWKELLGGK